jgi:hypothetical protein
MLTNTNSNLPSNLSGLTTSSSVWSFQEHEVYQTTRADYLVVTTRTPLLSRA